MKTKHKKKEQKSREPIHPNPSCLETVWKELKRGNGNIAKDESKLATLGLFLLARSEADGALSSGGFLGFPLPKPRRCSEGA